jgi:hypothetical protein
VPNGISYSTVAEKNQDGLKNDILKGVDQSKLLEHIDTLLLIGERLAPL